MTVESKMLDSNEIQTSSVVCLAQDSFEMHARLNDAFKVVIESSEFKIWSCFKRVVRKTSVIGHPYQTFTANVYLYIRQLRYVCITLTSTK